MQSTFGSLLVLLPNTFNLNTFQNPGRHHGRLGL